MPLSNAYRGVGNAAEFDPKFKDVVSGLIYMAKSFDTPLAYGAKVLNEHPEATGLVLKLKVPNWKVYEIARDPSNTVVPQILIPDLTPYIVERGSVRLDLDNTETNVYGFPLHVLLQWGK
jgi:hypothetical protein